jgi:hypothetical protein
LRKIEILIDYKHMNTNDIQNESKGREDICGELRTNCGQDEPEHAPGLTFGDAWDIQHSVGPSLDHDPKCSSVPGWHPLSGPALLCDCGAIEREWKRRHATPRGESDGPGCPVSAMRPAERPTPITDAARQEMSRTTGGNLTYHVHKNVSENLERHLAEARDQRDALAAALRNHECHYPDDSVTCPQCVALAAVKETTNV